MVSSFFLPLSLLLLLSPTALSQTCKSHKFSTPNKSFSTCADLPHLSATLHYTYDAATSTLSMAFTAPPSKSAGWVAWAVNPTATGMAGAQALVAYKSSNGSVAVSTLNIQSYSKISPGPLSVKVSGLAGETSGDKLTVFGTWHLPAKTSAINHVWQVGPSVNNGFPAKHDFQQANLQAKSKLQLTNAASSPAGSPAEAPSPRGPSAGSPEATSGVGAAAPVSGKNAAGEGLVGLKRFGAWLSLVLGAFGLLF